MAWVVACDGALFKVDPATGRCEASTLVAPPTGFASLRIAFVADGSAAGESLYVAGVSPTDWKPGADAAPESSILSRVRPPPAGPQERGMLAGWPVLAGTGDGQLWGAFPFSSRQLIPRLHRFDPRSADETGTTEASSAVWSSEDINPNPFAFWGGEFWLFLHEGGRRVARLPRTPRPGPNPVPEALGDGPRIVAAAASTCAPLQRP
jgi:hypothetical protein